MLKPQVRDRDGRLRLTVAFEPEVKALLQEVARHDRRSLSAEISHLVVERARTMGLNVTGHIGEKARN